jgi:hypothetical protein
MPTLPEHRRYVPEPLSAETVARLLVAREVVASLRPAQVNLDQWVTLRGNAARQVHGVPDGAVMCVTMWLGADPRFPWLDLHREGPSSTPEYPRCPVSRHLRGLAAVDAALLVEHERRDLRNALGTAVTSSYSGTVEGLAEAPGDPAPDGHRDLVLARIDFILAAAGVRQRRVIASR